MPKPSIFYAAIVALCGFCAHNGAQAKDMTFRVVNLGGAEKCAQTCAQAIAADGEISTATSQEFIDFVKQHAGDANVRAVVFLNSPGGSVAASLQLGNAFRAIQALVIVASVQDDSGPATELETGLCLSACVYAFMGGVKRILPANSRLGVHRMSAQETGPDPTGTGASRRLYDDGDMRAELVRYARRMGVSSEVIDYAESGPGDALRILSPKDVVRWKLAKEKF